MSDYFTEVNKALKEFHDWNKESDKDEFQSLSTEPYIKPLYMLIKVDVDADIVHDQDKAEKYAENHCNSLEYKLMDWYYPDDDQFPYIAK
jgi:hypothetical protein